MDTISTTTRTVRQAIEWLEKMGIEVKAQPMTTDMYDFKYDDVYMFMPSITPNDTININCLFEVQGSTEQKRKEVFDIVRSIVSKDLNDYDIVYAQDGLAWVGQEWVMPRGCYKLRRYQLKKMLEEMKAAYSRVFFISLVASAVCDKYRELLKKDAFPTP